MNTPYKALVQREEKALEAQESWREELLAAIAKRLVGKRIAKVDLTVWDEDDLGIEAGHSLELIFGDGTSLLVEAQYREWDEYDSDRYLGLVFEPRLPEGE